MATDREGRLMTGDDLITALVEAQDDATAREIVNSAPASAVRSAADLMYVDDDMGMRRLRNRVASEART
jgi:hypothetical protein